MTYFRAVNLAHMTQAYEKSVTFQRLTARVSMTPVFMNPQDERLDQRLRIPLSSYLLVEIRRETALHDALNQVFGREVRELKRPLKVRFANEGEEGVDHGGVQQDFFIVAFREALSPDYGLFTTDEQTRMNWFTVAPIEPIHKYELLGLLVGLAVYNGVTLPVTFPRILYKKLLGGEAEGLEDIEDGWGQLANGFRQLLEWKDDDVGDIFLRTYDFSYDFFGQVKYMNMLRARENGVEFLDIKLNKVRNAKPKLEKAHEWLPGPPLLGPPLPGSPLQDPSSLSADRDRWLSRMDEGFGNIHRIDGPSYQLTIMEWPGGNGGGIGREEGEGSGVDPGRDRGGEGSSDEPPEPTLSETTGAEEIGVASGDGEGQGTEPLEVDRQNDGAKGDVSQDADEKVETSPMKEGSGDTIEDSQGQSQVQEKGKEVAHVSFPPELLEEAPAAEDTPSPEEQEPEEEAPLVTNDNREAFVADYISWLTDRSIRRQYQAFEKGFFAVIDRKSLSVSCSSFFIRGCPSSCKTGFLFAEGSSIS